MKGKNNQTQITSIGKAEKVKMTDNETVTNEREREMGHSPFHSNILSDTLSEQNPDINSSPKHY